MPRTSTAGSADISIYTAKSSRMGNIVAQYRSDLTHFRDPIGQSYLRKECVDGRDPAVREWISLDPRVDALIHAALMISHDIFKNQKGVWASFGFTDHHGRWIAPAVGEIVGNALSEVGYKVCVNHLSV